jgi:hypothetical protein
VSRALEAANSAVRPVPGTFHAAYDVRTMSRTSPTSRRNAPTPRPVRLALAGALALTLAVCGASALGARRPAQGWGEWKLAKPAPALDGRPAKLEVAPPTACAECHAQIAEEWAATTHATAWVNEVYQEDLAGRKKAESCHGCHIPAPLHKLESLDAKPQPRPKQGAEAWHFGVSCESCHTGPAGEMLGPTGAPTDAHATRQHPGFVGAGSNALCAACHKTTVGPVIGIAKDFLASEAVAAGASCVECHLAPLREVDDGAGGRRTVRSHELQSLRDPAFLAQGFELSARREGELANFVVRNRAGHRVPGLVGRVIEFRVRLLDGAGAELSQAKLEFDTSSHLPLGESASVEVGRGGAKLAVQGWRHDPRLDKPVLFLERELGL